MSQTAIDFGREHRLNLAHSKVMRAINDAVDAIGLMVAAGACGCRTQDLSDALSGRTNRYVRIEWLLAICDIAPPDFRQRINTAFLEWQGLSLAPQKKRSAEDRLRDLEARVASELGAAGARVVEENRR